MNHQNRIPKMFGALVLGGSLLVNPSITEADPPSNSEVKPPSPPVKTKRQSPSSATRKPSPKPSNLVLERPKNDCQLEFTLYKYKKNDEIEAVKTCIDDKSDEEILKIIKEAKKETCRTPFCGCWLG